MTLYDFIAMDESNQAEAVWNGVFIADRETKEYRILLYAIDEFYVEVFYDNICNEIKRFRPFTKLELLNPYLVNSADVDPSFRSC